MKGYADGSGHVWIEENGGVRAARGYDERLAGLNDFIARCAQIRQLQMDMIPHDIKVVLERGVDLDLDELAARLGRTLTPDEVSYAGRVKYNRNYKWRAGR